MALFLPDANVLIHALRKDSTEHPACRQWLINAANLGDAIGLCELVEVTLLRIPTLPKLNLVPMVETLGYWKDDLWSYAGTRHLTAGARHAGLLAGFIYQLLFQTWLDYASTPHRFHKQSVASDGRSLDRRIRFKISTDMQWIESIIPNNNWKGRVSSGSFSWETDCLCPAVG